MSDLEAGVLVQVSAEPSAETSVDTDGVVPRNGEFVVTCADLDCRDGYTLQGRKYHYDDTVEEQWAPCGRMADTCPRRG